jgi:hypothetical protein
MNLLLVESISLDSVFNVISTLLISCGFQVPLESVCLIDKYSWLEVEKNLGEDLLQRLAKNMTVPLVVIR